MHRPRGYVARLTMDALTLDSPQQIREFIGELCARKVPGWVRVEGSDRALAGHFSSVEGKSLKFRLAEAPDSGDGAPVVQGETCLVEFVHRGRARAFSAKRHVPRQGRSWWRRMATSATSSSPPQSKAEAGVLSLQIPVRVDVQHKRRAFRIPVLGLGRLQLQLLHGSADTQAHAVPETDLVDISAVGMAIRRSQLPSDVPQWRLGQRLSAEIEFGRERVRVLARCERVTRDLVGFVFPESLREDEVQPPLRLARMLRELERQWLRHRVEAKEARAEQNAAERKTRSTQVSAT